jgi:hypothetical protein
VTADPNNATARQLWRLNNEGRLALTQNSRPLTRVDAGLAIAQNAKPGEVDPNQLPRHTEATTETGMKPWWCDCAIGDGDGEHAPDCHGNQSAFPLVTAATAVSQAPGGVAA